ncbi:MAG: sialate O-acetylesterase [Bacteroides sp.]|nr:sialate O-acetylesterase [Bacteroides sp.]
MRKLNLLQALVIFFVGYTLVSCSAGNSGKENPPEELHVYLCFGQSNMEGSAKIEAQDSLGIDERFMVLQAVDCPQSGRTRESGILLFLP